jgi:SpoIID/LytB domain protein
VNLVNILEVENYVKGVVANESIASFHAEALKSQAAAARGYANRQH